MGRRKRSENSESSTGIGAKKIKLQNVDGLEKGANKAGGNLTGTKKNKSEECRSNKLNMRINNYVGMSYQKLERYNFCCFSGFKYFCAF